ncbi:MAG: DUF922 domain-containing protein [Succinivibrionaceae bacterium]|nr:DUF922 domain-containing protein [Succinivibrionaceae bacterium]
MTKNKNFSYVLLSLLVSCISCVYAANEFEKFENADIPVKYEKLVVKNNSHYSTSNYDIEASTADELGEQLLANAPSSGRDMKSISLLQLSINWIINDQQNENFCDLSDVSINSEIDFILPNWRMDESVTDENAENWYNFLEAITSYQDQNKRIINKHLERFEKSIKDVKPVTLCSELENSINKIGNGIIENINQEINALQYETQNGVMVKNLKYPKLKDQVAVKKTVETAPEQKKEESKKPEAKKEESQKPEAKKEEPKKPEAKKEESKKPEAKKEEPKKLVAKKEEPKKPEAKKEEPKKPEAKKETGKQMKEGERVLIRSGKKDF